MTVAKSLPLYTQVKEKLLDAIRSGIYANGAKLPTEQELCERYQVSRTTVRLALQQLEFEGRITKIQGKGTFVQKEKIPHYTLGPIVSFSDRMQDLGKQSESRILEAGVIPSDQELEEILGIPEKSPVTKFVRLRFADHEPVSYEVCYIPWQIAPGLSGKNLTGSLFKLLKEEYNLQVYRSVDRLEPVIIGHDVAEILQAEPGSPAFQIKTVSYIKDGTPVEYSIGVFRSDLANFIVERRNNL